MEWLINFLDEEYKLCVTGKRDAVDLADSMYCVGQMRLIEKLWDMIETHTPYMSKQDIIDELAIMRDEERRGK
jgi:hypothetical protein